MFKKKSVNRRKYFLIDSNQQKRSRPKKTRNRTLNMLSHFLLIRHIFKFFRAKFLVTLFVIIMSGFIAFSLFSPYFEVKKITINRETVGVNIEAVQKRLKPFYGKNLILLDAEKIKQDLLNTFLDFRNVEIQEHWPDEIMVSIKLSPPAFTLLNMETLNFSTISADGVILSPEAQEGLPVIKVKGQTKPFHPGEKFIEEETLKRIKTIQGELQKKINLEINDIILLPDAQEVHFITNRKTALWFDLRTDPNEQVQKLELGAKRIGLYSKPLEHVDLRIPNQLFWK